MTSKEIIVLNELKLSKDIWNTGSTISSTIGYKTLNNLKLSQIELRSIIQNLRAMGEPIIASEKGYKYTTSIKELKDYCNSRRVEINKELRVLNAMETDLQLRTGA